MVQLPNAFDSNQHEDMNDFTPVPIGEYKVHITNSELKDTKAGTGKFVKFEFTILDGEYQGRKIWTQLNLVNPNPVAVEIAQKEFATLCRACNQPVVQNTEVLHGKPIIIKAGIQPAKGDFAPSNTIKGYAAIGGDSTPVIVTGEVNTGTGEETPANKQSAPADWGG